MGSLPRILALAGGVGAARFLRGLVRAVEPDGVTVVGNTADDLRLHGLHVSPDLDTVTYTLGGGADAERGWGRVGDTTTVLDELRSLYDEPAWFRLGDLDLATHLVRTGMLADGATLSEATARIAAAWRLPVTLRPMSDDPVETRIVTAGGAELGFQRWWVAEGGSPPVAGVRFAGLDEAAPAPGVLGAIAAADAVVLCPSNPVVSIAPILALPGVRAALRHVPVVGVSPIVGGGVLRGMADRLLPAVGCDVDAAAVAGTYADVLDGWVLDRRDADRAGAVAELGVAVAVTDTVMRDVEVTTELARAALRLVDVAVAS